MTLAPGTRLGPYQIVSAIGAGGMGEVYRGQDPKLGRAVAIKVLPERLSSDPEALARFEREARAVAALSHPNILGIYDFGSEAGVAFAVMELLEGETLRQKIAGAGTLSGAGGQPPRATALPARKSIDYARQIAQGLAAAHEKGIVHRDLKPENVFITRDGQVKVLDFGLAKQDAGAAGSDSTDSPTLSRHTKPGTVLGTVGYMSPEQVRGQPTDHRSDIFSFGAVLHEMLSGRRAFSGDSAVESMNAILKDDPPELPAGSGLPPGVERVVRRCLEKSPEERFQSARDLAFALDALASFSLVDARRPAIPGRRLLRLAAVGALAAALLLALGVLAPRFLPAWGGRAPASFRRLTFGRGTLRAARLTPDGQSVVYGASWNGAPLRLFLTRLDSMGSSPLSLPDGLVLAVAQSGELAVSVGHHYDDGMWVGSGTLARASLLGGAVREMVQDTRAADFSPDGGALALVRRVGEREHLEFPIGKTLYETVGYLSHARVSPTGDQVAFLDHPVYGDNRGSVAVVKTASGTRRTLTPEWPSVEGLAWSPDGREVWFTGSSAGEDNALHAVTLAARLRTVYRAPGHLVLHDAARSGLVLLTQEQFRGEISALVPGATQERDLSLLDLSAARAISSDGRLLLITQFGAGSGANYAVYLQKTDGSPAVRLGEGEAADLSRDGRWALAIQHGPPSRLVLLPTGPGEVRHLPAGDLVHASAAWLPDGRRILTCGSTPGRGARCFVQDVEGGAPPRAVSDEGMRVDRALQPRVSPDGTRFVAVGREGLSAIYPIDGGPPQPVQGLADGEAAIEWTEDGQGLFVHRPLGVPRRVDRLELRTGRRTPWREIAPSDPAGVLSNLGILVTPDGRSYAIVFYRLLSTLYLAEGLR